MDTARCGVGLLAALSLVGGCKSSSPGAGDGEERKAQQGAPSRESDQQTSAEAAERSQPARDSPRPGGGSPTDPFFRPRVSETGQGVRIQIERVPGRELAARPVPYTAEPYVVLVRDPGPTVAESDIAGTGLAMDLDGDGDTQGTIPVSCSGGRAVVGNATLAPVSDGSGGPMRYRQGEAVAGIGEAGAQLMLYSPCDDAMAVVGLSPPGQPLELKETGGPALQVMIFEPATSPELGEPLALSFRRDGAEVEAPLHFTASSEPIFGKDVMWTRMSWAMVPLSEADAQTVEVTLPEGSARRMVSARVNVSPASGVRQPGSPGFLELKTR